MASTGREQAVRSDRRRRLGAVVLGLAAATALVPNLGGAATAGAAVVTADAAALTWKVSEHAWSSSSLSPSHATEAPATKEADGFRFGAGGGTYDAETGAASIHFGGSITLGNVLQGGYRIRLGNPHLVLADDGSGELRADVAHCASAAACTAGFTTVTDVVVAELTDVTLAVHGARRTATVVPEFELVPGQADGRRQFPQPFLDALPASLQPHFRQTGSSADAHKAPAPLTFAFDVQEPATTTTAAPSSTSTTVPPSSSTSTTAAVPSSTTSTTVPASSTTSTTRPDDGDQLTAGRLEWGVKASFRSYITGPVAHGSATPGDGAEARADGTFAFPLDGGTLAEDGALSAAFGGAVHFTGHEGALDLTLTDPRVAIDGDEGILVVDARTLALGDATATTYDDVPFAALDLSGTSRVHDGAELVLGAVPAVLTAEGAPAFAGFYEPGTELDPVTLVVSAGGDVPPSTSTSTSTTAPPPAAGCLDRTTVVAGSTVAVCGDGFLPGEQVQVVLHSNPVVLAAVAADGSGAVAAQVVVPAATPAGSHRLELRGVTSGHRLFTTPFAVVAAAPTSTARPSGALPRTGGSLDDAARAALVLVGLGLLLTGRSLAR